MKKHQSTRRSNGLSGLHALLRRMLKNAPADDLGAWERIEKLCRLIVTFEALPCGGGPCPYIQKEG